LDSAHTNVVRMLPIAKDLELHSNSLEVQYMVASFEQELGSIEMARANQAPIVQQQLKRWEVARDWFAHSVERFKPIAAAAKLDVHDRVPVDLAGAGLQQSEAALKRLTENVSLTARKSAMK